MLIMGTAYCSSLALYLQACIIHDDLWLCSLCGLWPHQMVNHLNVFNGVYILQWMFMFSFNSSDFLFFVDLNVMCFWWLLSNQTKFIEQWFKLICLKYDQWAHLKEDMDLVLHTINLMKRSLRVMLLGFTVKVIQSFSWLPEAILQCLL